MRWADAACMAQVAGNPVLHAHGAMWLTVKPGILPYKDFLL